MANITEKSIKILWANSGNICAFPECNIRITGLAEKTSYTLGEMAHIKGNKHGSNRYDSDQSDKDRHDHTNLILLCPTHHTLIDKPENESIYTVNQLKKIKKDHEASVAAKLKIEGMGNLNNLKKRIIPYLKDNYSVWMEYGPNSEKARRDPQNAELYQIWLQARIERIVPNNRIILELVKANRMLFDTKDQQIVSEFITHVESYEMWVTSSNTYESVKPFPQTFNELIHG